MRVRHALHHNIGFFVKKEHASRIGERVQTHFFPNELFRIFELPQIQQEHPNKTVDRIYGTTIYQLQLQEIQV